MGIFRKKSAEEERLMVVVSSVAQAVAKSRFGMMPPDFASDIIDASRAELPELYRAVAAASGEKVARKASVKHASMVAGVWSQDQGVSQSAFAKEVEDIVERLIAS